VQFPAGDACASGRDCATGTCLGGCCCAAGVSPRACASGACACWANASTTAATAGACTAGPGAPPTGAGGAGARAVLFPDWAAIPAGVRPLLVLLASSPGNPYAVDVIVATREACAAYARAPGAGVACDPAQLWVVDGTQYYYLATAEEMRMVPVPPGQM